MGERGEGTRSERKRRDIMKAGQSVFLREGYSGAGMEVVAREASVSTATLYAHFPSKGDLFVAVVEAAVAKLADDIEDSLDGPGDARQRLLGFSLAYARFYTDPLSRAVFRLVTGERRRFTELADHFRNRSRHKLGGAAITLIGDLVEKGQLKVDKPSWAAGQLLGMLEHVTLTFGLVAGDDAAPRRPVDDFCADAVETFLARYGA